MWLDYDSAVAEAVNLLWQQPHQRQALQSHPRDEGKQAMYWLVSGLDLVAVVGRPRLVGMVRAKSSPDVAGGTVDRPQDAVSLAKMGALQHATSLACWSIYAKMAPKVLPASRDR